LGVFIENRFVRKKKIRKGRKRKKCMRGVKTKKRRHKKCGETGSIMGEPPRKKSNGAEQTLRPKKKKKNLWKMGKKQRCNLLVEGTWAAQNFGGGGGRLGTTGEKPLKRGKKTVSAQKQGGSRRRPGIKLTGKGNITFGAMGQCGPKGGKFRGSGKKKGNGFKLRRRGEMGQKTEKTVEMGTSRNPDHLNQGERTIKGGGGESRIRLCFVQKVPRVQNKNEQKKMQKPRGGVRVKGRHKGEGRFKRGADFGNWAMGKT